MTAWLARPAVTDIDDPRAISEVRAIVRGKPFLRRIYEEWYATIAAARAAALASAARGACDRCGAAISAALLAAWRGVYSVVLIGVPLAALTAYLAFCIWYCTIFGTYQPLHATYAFVLTWLISEGLGAVVIRPITAFLLVVYTFTLEPFLGPSLAWMPCFRPFAPSAPAGGTAVSFSPIDTAPMSRALDTMTVARAVSFACAVGPDTALMAQPGGLQIMARAFADRWAEVEANGGWDAAGPGSRMRAMEAANQRQRRRLASTLFAVHLAEVAEVTARRAGVATTDADADAALAGGGGDLGKVVTKVV